MAINESTPMRFVPRGLSDSYDATDAFPGACQTLTNLVFDQGQRELVVSRPGVVSLANLSASGIPNPKFISIQVSIGTRVYGMVASSLNAGHDQPFCFDTATNSLIVVSGTQSTGTCPTSPLTTGDWIPPTIATIGTMVVVTHPGFGGGAVKFGWFDVTTPATPVWHAGDTATNALISIPNAVANFNNRAWFACGNQLFYTDVLTNPLTRTNATQALTIGDSANVNALAGLPLLTTSSGVLATLTVFKTSQVWQIAGDTTTSNLTEQYISLNIGTTAPRSVVQSPLGMYFMSTGGPYFIDQTGVVRPVTNQLGQLEPDLQTPFQNAQTPTRWAAGYTSNIYRICGPTVIHGQFVTNDYWFDEHKRRWNGPHSFQYDCVSAIGGSFVLSSANNAGQLMANYPDQNIASVYTDLGTPFNFNLLTSTFPKTNDMLTKQVAESQIEFSSSAGEATYTLTAENDQNVALATATINVGITGTPWGSFVWGDGTVYSVSEVWGGGSLWGSTAQGGSNAIWLSSQQIPHTYPVPWPAPFVFEKMQLQVTGTASANVGIGTFYARYQKTGYMVTLFN